MQGRSSTAIITGALALLLCAAPSPTLAGPWTHEPGHGYLKLWLRWLPAIEFSDGTDAKRHIGSYHEVFFNGYAELGVSNGLTFSFHLPALRTFFAEDLPTGETRAHIAPGDPTLGAVIRLKQHKNWILSGEVGVTIPVADAKPVQTIYEEPANDTSPPTPLGDLQLGTGVVSIPLRLSTGFSFSRGYVAGSFGYVIQTDGYVHELVFSIEGGYRFGERFSLRNRIHGRYPLPIGSAPRHSSLSGVGNGTSYTAGAIDAEYRVSDHFAFGLSIEGGLFAVRRQARGPVTSLFGAFTF